MVRRFHCIRQDHEITFLHTASALSQNQTGDWLKSSVTKKNRLILSQPQNANNSFEQENIYRRAEYKMQDKFRQTSTDIPAIPCVRYPVVTTRLTEPRGKVGF